MYSTLCDWTGGDGDGGNPDITEFGPVTEHGGGGNEFVCVDVSYSDGSEKSCCGSSVQQIIQCAESGP